MSDEAVNAFFNRIIDVIELSRPRKWRYHSWLSNAGAGPLSQQVRWERLRRIRLNYDADMSAFLLDSQASLRNDFEAIRPAYYIAFPKLPLFAIGVETLDVISAVFRLLEDAESWYRTESGAWYYLASAATDTEVRLIRNQLEQSDAEHPLQFPTHQLFHALQVARAELLQHASYRAVDYPERLPCPPPHIPLDDADGDTGYTGACGTCALSPETTEPPGVDLGRGTIASVQLSITGNNGGEPVTKSLKELRTDRNDWLLDNFAPYQRDFLPHESTTGGETYGDMVAKLFDEAAKHGWSMLEEPSSVSYALKKAFAERHPGQLWPWDGRGKKPKAETT